MVLSVGNALPIPRVTWAVGACITWEESKNEPQILLVQVGSRLSTSLLRVSFSPSLSAQDPAFLLVLWLILAVQQIKKNSPSVIVKIKHTHKMAADADEAPKEFSKKNFLRI